MTELLLEYNPFFCFYGYFSEWLINFLLWYPTLVYSRDNGYSANIFMIVY
jgi:hypothetical protein